MPKTLVYPDNFKPTYNDMFQQWVYEQDNKRIFSIIKGPLLGHQNYEMRDYREEYPQSNLTRDEINEHLTLHPVYLNNILK